MPGEVRARRQEGIWGGDDGGKQRVQGRARLQIGGRARGGAHVEHVLHVYDAGGVEAQRLVERRRALPRVERRACGAGRGVRVRGQQAVEDRGARSVQGRARLQIGGQSTRGGAHVEHIVHVCDAGGVEAQQLVELIRALPRVERWACGAGQGVRVGGSSRRWTTAAHAACRAGLDCRLGAGYGENARRTS